MNNETNRSIIVLVAGLWIILMAVVIFLAWAADKDAADKLQDFTQYLSDHRTSAGKLIVTLAALVTVVLALLLIIVELGPEDETSELRVEQAGATTIVPAEALRRRLEEALLALPDVTVAKARVSTRDKGIASALDVTVTPAANVAFITQEASRVVVDTIQTDLGLPVAGLPTVRIAFGAPKAAAASSISQPPRPEPPPASPSGEGPEPDLAEVETVDERIEVEREPAQGITGSTPDAPPAPPPAPDHVEGPPRETDERWQP